MPSSLFPTTAAFLCFTVLVGSEGGSGGDRSEAVGEGGAAAAVVGYWRCGPGDECLCLADSQTETDDGCSQAVCGDNAGGAEAIISELVLQLGRRGETPRLVSFFFFSGEDEEKDGATVTKETPTGPTPSVGTPFPDLEKQSDGKESSDTTVWSGQRRNNGEAEKGEEKEVVVRRRNVDADSIRTTTAVAAGDKEGKRATKREQRLGDKLGPQLTIDQQTRSMDAAAFESEKGNSGRRMQTTFEPTATDDAGPGHVYIGSGPRNLCSFNSTVSLTLLGNYEAPETLACLTGLKRLSLYDRPLDKIDGNTFNRFREFRLKELQVGRSNLSAILNGAFRVFRENLFSLDLSRNRLESIDSRSISELPLLRMLNVSSNRMRNASFLLSARTEFPTNLQILDLSNNAIESVSLMVDADEINTIDDVQSSESKLKSSDSVKREISRYLTTPLRSSVDIPTTTSNFRASTEKPVEQEKRRSDSRFRNLQIIDLSRNRLMYLSNFSFVDLVELRELRLSDNCIADIESDAFVLSRRYFTTNTVTHRATRGTDDDDNAQEYYISSALCNRGWPNLHLIDLSHNNLSFIRDGALSGALCTVRRLLLSHNRIDQLPRYLVERLPYLEHIDLSHNELVWLDVGAFTNPSLVSICLSHNRLRKIISMTFLYLPSVTHIDLSHNGLVYLYKFAFYRLCSAHLSVSISLRSNQLQTDGVWKLLSTFQHLGDTNCHVSIDLSDNNVTRFLGDALGFVKDRLAVADVQHFSHWLQVEIDLSENQIRCDCPLVDDYRAMAKIYDSIVTNRSSAGNKKSNLDSWKQLTCSTVSEDGEMATTVATYLTMSSCDGDVCFDPCTCSRDRDGFAYSVNCSHLQLDELPRTLSRSSETLSRVRFFDLSTNNLTAVDGNVLRQMTSLEEIHLRNNRLTSVPSEMLNLTGLRRLSLAANPLRCNCSDVRFHDLLRHFTDLVQDWNEITCTIEGSEDDPVTSIIKIGAGSNRQIRRLNEKNASDLCTLKDVSALNSTVSSTEQETIVYNWVRVTAVCLSFFLFFVAAVSLRGLKRWLCRRRTRRRRGHGGGSKVSDTTGQGEMKPELMVYCDQSQKRWVRMKLVALISRQFSHHQLNVIVETLPVQTKSSAAGLRSGFPADVNHLRGPDVSRTTLILLSKDWIDRVKDHASGFQVDDFVDFSSSACSSSTNSSSFVQTVLILISKDINISDVHALHCVLEQFPCLDIDEPLFESQLFQHLERSIHMEARPTNNTKALLKLTNGQGYEPISANLRKY